MDDAAAYSFRRELMLRDVDPQSFFQRYHLRRNTAVTVHEPGEARWTRLAANRANGNNPLPARGSNL